MDILKISIKRKQSEQNAQEADIYIGSKNCSFIFEVLHVWSRFHADSIEQEAAI